MPGPPVVNADAIMAVALVIFGPDNDDQLQILTMLTPTIGVLLLLLVLTPDGYHRAGWVGWPCTARVGVPSRWP